MKTSTILSSLSVMRFLLLIFIFSNLNVLSLYGQQHIRENFLVESVSKYESPSNYAHAEFIYDTDFKLQRKNISGKIFENNQIRDLNYVDEFEYENGLITKIKINDYTHFMFSHELHFMYNNQNQIVRKEIWKNGLMIEHLNYHIENNRVVSIYDDYTSPFDFSTILYDNDGNVFSHTQIFPVRGIGGDPIPGQFESRELIYEYDDAPKPNFGLDYLHGYQPFPWLGSIVDIEMLSSKNNMTKAISQQESFIYTYNEFGLPATLQNIFDPIIPSTAQVYTITYMQIQSLSTPIQNTPKLHVYPNPTTNVVNIECEMSGIIYFYDMLGREVLSEYFNNNVQISTELLSIGTYHIKLISDDGLISTNTRLIKK